VEGKNIKKIKTQEIFMKGRCPKKNWTVEMKLPPIYKLKLGKITNNSIHHQIFINSVNKMEGIAVQRAEEMPTPQMVNTTKWQLNPKAKEFLPLLPPPTKSLPPTPPPPPLPEHVVWHGGWFFSPPLPPPVLKPNFKYFPCPTPITAYSCCNFIPPVLKLPSTTQTTLPSGATVDGPPAKPGFIRNRLRSSRRRGMVGHWRPRTMRRRGCNLPKTTADCASVEKDKKNDEQEVVEEKSSALIPPLPPPPLPTASDEYCGYPFGRSTTCLMIRNIPVRLRFAFFLLLCNLL